MNTKADVLIVATRLDMYCFSRTTCEGCIFDGKGICTQLADIGNATDDISELTKKADELLKKEGL